MAIILEANYSKKLGLPGFSSHQYSVTIRTEVTDFTMVPAENARLYSLQQSCVDKEIQKTGYLPVNDHGNSGSSLPCNGNGKPDGWACSPKQKALILQIVEERHLDKNSVEELAQQRFGKSVRALNKLEASALLDELLGHVDQTGNGTPRQFKSRPDWEVAQ